MEMLQETVRKRQANCLEQMLFGNTEMNGWINTSLCIFATIFTLDKPFVTKFCATAWEASHRTRASKRGTPCKSDYFTTIDSFSIRPIKRVG